MTAKFEFEAALKELENITTWFESSDVDLDQGLIKFERGMELASQLKAHLEGVENRVEKIKARFSGTPSASEMPAAKPSTPNNAPEASGTSYDETQTDIFGV